MKPTKKHLVLAFAYLALLAIPAVISGCLSAKDADVAIVVDEDPPEATGTGGSSSSSSSGVGGDGGAPIEENHNDGGILDTYQHLCDNIRPWCRYPDPWDPNYDATYVWPPPLPTPQQVAQWGQPKCYCMCAGAPDPHAFCQQKVDVDGNPSPTGTQVANDCGVLLKNNGDGTQSSFFPMGYPPVCRITGTTVP